MLKKLLVSLLSTLLCISVVAETESQLNGNQNETDVKIDEKGDVFVAPLKYHITSDSTAEVIKDGSYKKLESVVIPSEIRIGGHVYSVTSIGDYAFGWCDRLTHIEIPSSVTSIGKESFSFCSGLTSIEIPSSVTSIGNKAFSFCSGLTSINVSNDNPYYSSDEGILYDKNKTVLICAPKGKKGEIKIPSGVTRIEGSAFRYCRYVKNIMISSNVTSIGEWAFSGCFSLTSVNIPSSLTSIGKCAFMWCTSLTSVEISFGLTSIRESVFNGCSSLTSISIPSSVISIGDGAFSDCKALTSINIPSSVTSIGKKAFYGCENLEIVIDNSKENVIVEENTFEDCKSVKFLK